MPRWLRAYLALAACALAASTSARASAYYEEARVTQDDVRVEVDPSGLAHVEHVVGWHIVAGQLHFLDVDPRVDVTPEPIASAVADDGRTFSAVLVPNGPLGLRVLFDEPKGLRRGRYTVRFAYQEDLAAKGDLSREGSLLRLSIRGLRLTDGYDDARASFVLPHSAQAPRPADPESDFVVLSTVRQAADKDEIELTAPHVARHQDLVWALWIASTALPGVRHPTSLPPIAASHAPSKPSRALARFLLASLLVAAFYAALVQRKVSKFTKACVERGAPARGLFPFSREVRAVLAGVAIGSGVFLELMDAPTWGAGFIAMAMLLAACRVPNIPILPRAVGPGHWLALRPAEAFAASSRDSFDPWSPRGWFCALGAVALGCGAGVLLRRFGPQTPFLFALDSCALLPLLATGRVSQLPPKGDSSAPWLGRLFARLAKEKRLRVSPWARLPQGGADAEELRLLVLPRAAMPGLVGIEIGLAFWKAGTCYAASPEVLVRVHDATAACARMTTLRTGWVPTPGRRPEERVYRLAPRLPTRDGTLRLVRRLGHELTDRRRSEVARDGLERRVPANQREKVVPQAA
jgi:hypothetical protein